MTTIENIIYNKDDDVPQKLNETAPKLVSINTKLYVVLLLSILFNIIQGFWINAANQRAENNTELMYLKMYPNGSWDVEYINSGTEADFFPLTIDKLLQDYVIARYSVFPESIRRDYGFSLIFMSPALSTEFVGTAEGQYNAARKAEAFRKRGTTEAINIRFVDHYDVSKGVFVNGNSDLYRTNIFIQRVITDRSGVPVGEPINEVVHIHWRLKPIKEVKQQTREELRGNPLGLEIVREKINLDLSDNE